MRREIIFVTVLRSHNRWTQAPLVERPYFIDQVRTISTPPRHEVSYMVIASLGRGVSTRLRLKRRGQVYPDCRELLHKEYQYEGRSLLSAKTIHQLSHPIMRPGARACAGKSDGLPSAGAGERATGAKQTAGSTAGRAGRDRGRRRLKRRLSDQPRRCDRYTGGSRA